MRQQHDLAGSPQGGSASDRTAERRTIRKHAILHCHDRVQTILIRDISVGGMKIQNAFGLIDGDSVKVELLTRRVFEGKIAWSYPPYCGIQFNTPLSDTDLLLTTPVLRAAQA